MYIDFELHYKDRSSSEFLGTALLKETSWLTTNVWMACWSPNFSQGCVAPYEIIWFLKDWISVRPIPNWSNFSWDELSLVSEVDEKFDVWLIYVCVNEITLRAEAVRSSQVSRDLSRKIEGPLLAGKNEIRSPKNALCVYFRRILYVWRSSPWQAWIFTCDKLN